MLNTFKRGGVHPDDGKIYAKDKAIETPAVPAQVVIPMSQHFGAPCTPTVKVGDLVKKGQLIGTSDAFLHADIHASTSGKVIKVAPMPHNMMVKCMAVVIEADGKDEWAEGIPQAHDWKQLDSKEILELIKKAGVVGCGGATFPAHVKLAPNKPVDTFIVNGAECEPYLTCDYRAMVEKETTDKLVTGVQICMKVLGVKKAFIGIEDNKPEAIQNLTEAFKDIPEVTVLACKTKYPQGAEKQLIYAITGREVPSGGLPAAVGCAVFNAATVRAIRDVVYDGMPLIQRIVTVSGDILMEPKNLLVPIGTSFNDLIEACGRNENPYKVLSGGPMMGVAQYDLSVPTIKGVNAVTVLGRNNHHFVEDPHCLRCGKCIDACPMKLMPVLMYKAWQGGDVEEMKKNNIMDCIECGSCAYTCPASVPLVLGFRVAKQVIRNASAPVKK